MKTVPQAPTSGRGRRDAREGQGARIAAPLAWTLCSVCLALAVGSVLFGVFNGRRPAEILIDEGIVTIATLAVAFSVVGALIASHRPRNSIGWILCCAALFQGLSVFGIEYANYALLTRPGTVPLGAEMSWLANWVWAPGLGLILVFVPLLFPDGRPPSRRWRWVGWLGGASILMISVLAMILLWPERGAALLGEVVSDESGSMRILELLGGAVAFPLMLLAGLVAVVSLFVRFHRARGDERQQIKWLATAAALTLLWIFVIEVPPDGNKTFETVTALLSVVIVPSIPVAAGIAILRYRLYDIDVVINRALVYGILTVSLVLVYLGCVVSLQYAFRALTGGVSQLAIVTSTLAIAALFNPFRRRIQVFIDRRFYRRKYDATRTLATFSAKLREETDLGHLGDELVEVVRETVQPEHVALWLRASSADTRDQNLARSWKTDG